MVSVQPILLPINTSSSQSTLPKNVKTLFYLSWEDALWDILEKKQIPKNTTVLVPSFFCGDVEQNIKNHGYTIEQYAVDKNLLTQTETFIAAVKKYNPSVVVIFHAVGITNTLLDDFSKWKNVLTPNTMLIEDCVHRIVEPHQVTLLHPNHFIISSLRKVVPLQGSVLYGKPESVTWNEPPLRQSFFYTASVTAWWAVMVLFWKLTNAVSNTVLSKYLAFTAEKTMLLGYDVIGDALQPAAGWRFFYQLYKKIDIQKIKSIKKVQAVCYEQAFPHIQPLYTTKDRGELRGWPLVLPNNGAEHFLTFVRDNGLLLRFELNDSLWSTKQKIVYLPMGPHITSAQQEKIVTTVTQALALSYNEASSYVSTKNKKP